LPCLVRLVRWWRTELCLCLAIFVSWIEGLVLQNELPWNWWHKHKSTVCNRFNKSRLRRLENFLLPQMIYVCFDLILLHFHIQGH
jgi:hypothetical protein